ncbi:MAG: type II secretion system protein [Chloroflexi bacterium]|nr:type II secretion system protein [Chloroflexota bacterium]MDA1220150.1 type II secretion system protein [Chloroflexota bacterium]
MKRITFSEKGFTLIEILIAVGILALLAGIAVPTVGVLLGNSETKAEAAELSNVQAAIDFLMADQEMATITAVAVASSDMTAFPGAAPRLNPNYLRSTSTRCEYTVTAGGTVSQASCP